MTEKPAPRRAADLRGRPSCSLDLEDRLFLLYTPEGLGPDDMRRLSDALKAYYPLATFVFSSAPLDLRLRGRLRIAPAAPEAAAPAPEIPAKSPAKSPAITRRPRSNPRDGLTFTD